MADTQMIKCPQCGCEISVNDVLHAQIEAQLRKQYEMQEQKNNTEIERLRSELNKQIEETKSEKQNIDLTVANKVKLQLVEREKEIKKPDISSGFCYQGKKLFFRKICIFGLVFARFRFVFLCLLCFLGCFVNCFTQLHRFFS